MYVYLCAVQVHVCVSLCCTSTCMCISVLYKYMYVYLCAVSDGRYHVTVQALSRIDFGGPMSLAVCHSTPYTVDTTPPVIHEIHSVTYNETSFLVTCVVNST